jgi:hypothetical protein
MVDALGRNRLLAEPHRQIATLAQACLIGWPFVSRCFGFGIWWRHLALALNGTAGIRDQA